MCGTVMRGADALPGSKATSRAKGSHRKLGGLGLGHRCRVGAEYDGPHRRRGAEADDARIREVGPRHSSWEVGEQRGAPLGSSPRRGQPQRSRWSEGRGPRGMRTGKARTGLSARPACHKRRNACGNCSPFGPEVGAVCGKAARTVLCGGRAMKRTSLPLRKREFIAGVGSAAAWPLVLRPSNREPHPYRSAVERGQWPP